MSVPATPRRSRRSAVVLVAVLAALIAAVVIIGFVTAGAAGPSSAPTPTVPAASATPSTTASSSPSATPTPTKTPKSTKTPVPTKSTTPTPQPTKTAAISSPAPIVKELTAKVSKLEAVQGKAQGPGEIAGPAVRFTIVITNSTGKKISLSNTVVNAYYGKGATPAVELQNPGGKSFPPSVASGKSATGVFVFNIAEADRADVQVTVDTSVRNPVVAFKGPAPR